MLLNLILYLKTLQSHLCYFLLSIVIFICFSTYFFDNITLCINLPNVTLSSMSHLVYITLFGETDGVTFSRLDLTNFLIPCTMARIKNSKHFLKIAHILYILIGMAHIHLYTRIWSTTPKVPIWTSLCWLIRFQKSLQDLVFHLLEHVHTKVGEAQAHTSALLQDKWCHITIVVRNFQTPDIVQYCVQITQKKNNMLRLEYLILSMTVWCIWLKHHGKVLDSVFYLIF